MTIGEKKHTFRNICDAYIYEHPEDELAAKAALKRIYTMVRHLNYWSSLSNGEIDLLKAMFPKLVSEVKYRWSLQDAKSE